MRDMRHACPGELIRASPVVNPWMSGLVNRRRLQGEASPHTVAISDSSSPSRKPDPGIGEQR